MTSLHWAGNSLLIVLRHCPLRLSYTLTATRNFPFLLVSICTFVHACVFNNHCFKTFACCIDTVLSLTMFLCFNNSLFSLFITQAITAVRTNTANLSDAAMWKIRRARFARNQQKSVRSLRDSVKGTCDSKRAFSLPETFCAKLRELFHSSVLEPVCFFLYFYLHLCATLLNTVFKWVQNLLLGHFVCFTALVTAHFKFQNLRLQTISCESFCTQSK